MPFLFSANSNLPKIEPYFAAGDVIIPYGEPNNYFITGGTKTRPNEKNEDSKCKQDIFNTFGRNIVLFYMGRVNLLIQKKGAYCSLWTYIFILYIYISLLLFFCIFFDDRDLTIESIPFAAKMKRDICAK